MLFRSDAATRSLHAANEELLRISTVDALTGVANRRRFDEALHVEWLRARRDIRALSLLMIDIDHFKSVNDTYGHPVGDVVLREVARRVADELRTVDRAMRFGGEELALIIVQTERAGALDVARRAVRAVEQEPILVSDNTALNVTVSAGVAAMPQDAKSGLTLLNAADKALYAAKARGRNRAVAFNEI